MAERSDAARNEGRAGEVWRAYYAGETQVAIGERLGISQQRVSQIIAEVVEAIPEEEIEQRKRRHLDLLDEMTLIMTEQARADLPPAFSSSGKRLVTEEGSPVRDTSARMGAVDRLGRLLERQAKLLGLDAASKVDLNLLAQQRAAEIAAEVAAEAGAFEPPDDLPTGQS